jgi:hypothetical protein
MNVVVEDQDEIHQMLVNEDLIQLNQLFKIASTSFKFGVGRGSRSVNKWN